MRIYLFVKHENILVSKDSIYILPQKQQQAQLGLTLETGLKIQHIKLLIYLQLFKRLLIEMDGQLETVWRSF